MNSPNEWGSEYLLNDTKFMDTSFTIHFKITSVCYKVFVDCTIHYGEFMKVLHNIKQQKTAPLAHRLTRELALGVEFSKTLDPLDLQNPISSNGTHFIE